MAYEIKKARFDKTIRFMYFEVFYISIRAVFANYSSQFDISLKVSLFLFLYIRGGQHVDRDRPVRVSVGRSRLILYWFDNYKIPE